MKSSLTHRIVAALASMVITFSLFSAVVSEADAPAGAILVAQATTTATPVTVR